MMNKAKIENIEIQESSDSEGSILVFTLLGFSLSRPAIFTLAFVGEFKHYVEGFVNETLEQVVEFESISDIQEILKDKLFSYVKRQTQV